MLSCSTTKKTYFVSAGPLCISVHDKRDRRLDDDFETFKRFNRSLVLTCEKGRKISAGNERVAVGGWYSFGFCVAGDPAILEVTPNSSWPDVVYYHSFTHSNMGWKVHIVDNLNTRDSASTLILRPYSSTVIIGICIFLCLLWYYYLYLCAKYKTVLNYYHPHGFLEFLSSQTWSMRPDIAEETSRQFIALKNGTADKLVSMVEYKNTISSLAVDQMRSHRITNQKWKRKMPGNKSPQKTNNLLTSFIIQNDFFFPVFSILQCVHTYVYICIVKTIHNLSTIKIQFS